MRSVSLGIAALFLAAALPRFASAEAPRTLSFHGVLAGADSTPVADGEHVLTFRLYDALTDGNLLWTEADRTVAVAGGQGRFNAVLGDPTPFALAFDLPYFLEIQVAGEDAPMAPRLPLAAAPYALNASGGAATLELPFAGAISADSTYGITVNSTGGGSGGFRAITDSGRGFWGTTNGSYGIYGEAKTTGVGVQGVSISSAGVAGFTTTGVGVLAQSAGTGQGLRAISGNRAVWATSTGASYGVFAESDTGIGVQGRSNAGTGVAGISGPWVGTYGQSDTSFGVWGASNSSSGVVGTSTAWYGVYGESANSSGVVGVSKGAASAVYGRSDGGGLAGHFDGRVRVNVLEIMGGADLAENFNVSEAAEPGTVMAIDTKNPGRLRIAQGTYNRKVAGVVSGANRLEAGMVLTDPAAPTGGVAVALTGRVWVKCDASNGPIEPGDMLTTSETPGHAMKVTDHGKAMGATVGKAMTGLETGEGLVLALVSLQ